jgi:Family of unknown function (DUF6263)
MKSARFGVSLLCLVAVVVFSAVGSAAGAETTLRWKFEKGQKLGYALTQKTSMKMEVMGMKTETTFTQTADMTWEVTGVDKDGNGELLQTIDRFRFHSKTQGAGEMDIDTANAQDPAGAPEAMTKLFRAIAGSPFKMKITPLGEISDFSVPAKVVEAFKDAGPAGAMFGSEESLKNMAGGSLVPFPEAAIAQGKSWNGVRKMPMPFGTMVMDTTYKLEAATSPIENIGLDVKVKIEPKEGVPVEVKVTSQDTKGHFRFDNSAGILTASDLVQKMTMTLTVSGQEITQDIETTSNFELKKDGGSK